MNAAQLRKVKRGDILQCNVGGRIFYAHADRLDKRNGDNGVIIEPIPGKGSAVSHYWVSGSDVTQHYVRREL